ncbi:hypothetical protein [Tenacibaculum sp. 190524A02b]|uniref:hypothetical protein n=1 Tax=Tenacibaculum vairaonense TaxID=3137860 RepID=UPI0031FA5480
MKNLLLISFCFISLTFQAQSSQIDIISDPDNYFQNNEGVYRYDTTKKDVKGSKFRFKSKNVEGSILDGKGDNYTLKGLNVDNNEDKFTYSISKDSLFYFDHVKKAKINGVFFLKKEGKILEVLSEGRNISLYLHNEKIIKKEMVDKLSGKIVKPKQWLTKKSYYIHSIESDELIKTKLKKKSILKLLEKGTKKEITSFLKKNKLNLKKEVDVIKLLNYYNTL